MHRTLRILPWVSGAFLIACTGSLDGPAGSTRDLPVGPPVHAPSSVRRLNQFEYDNAVNELLGTSAHPSSTLAGDARLAGYTSSADLRVDTVLADQFRLAAEALAVDAVTNHHATIVPCVASDGACPRTFVEAIASRAFRRPATAEEVEALLGVFDTAATGSTFDEGATAVIEAVLQSASFLYIPQIGGPQIGGPQIGGPQIGSPPAGSGAEDLVLDGYETASAISFLLTASPPDAELLTAAASGELATPVGREAHARRILMEDPRARVQVTRFIREWLGTDTLANLSRTSSTADFASLRPAMDEETQRFVEAVLFDGDGTLEALLTADFTVADGALATFYGLPAGESGWARRDLSATSRRGILSQAAFLAAHARGDASSPVKRGVTILSRLLCQSIPFPTGETARRAMMDPPSGRTTRERFAEHARNPTCAACHARIDPIGFAFEHFDQIGAYRAEENGVAVDASGTLSGTGIEGSFEDTPELVALLARSPQAHACFARNVYRFASGSLEAGPEETFLSRWREMPRERRTSLVEMLVELVASESFVQRRETP